MTTPELIETLRKRYPTTVIEQIGNKIRIGDVTLTLEQIKTIKEGK